MVLRLRICNDLLFYDDYRPGFSSAFVVVYGGGWVMGCVWVVVVGFRGAWGRVVSVVAFVVCCAGLFLFWQRVQFYIRIFVALFMCCLVLR